MKGDVMTSFIKSKYQLRDVVTKPVLQGLLSSLSSFCSKLSPEKCFSILFLITAACNSRDLCILTIHDRHASTILFD